MNIKEQEIIEKYLSEATTADYEKLSTSELKDLLDIFKNVGRSSAQPILKALKGEWMKRLKKESNLDEAKVVPFKGLEQAWSRTDGDKDKQAKLIKKYDLKKLISSVRPGEIKLGIKNKLLGTTKAATAAGLDSDDQLIFITNNPLKIIYPKKSGRRPEGEEIKESVKAKDLDTLRLEKMVSLVINENNQSLIEAFVDSSNIDITTSPSKIREAYKAFNLTESAKVIRKVSKETELHEASMADIKKVLAAAKKAGADIKGNKIDFGEGSLIGVSIEKGKIKFDGGMSTGVEYFNNAKDAIMAFESVDLEEVKCQVTKEAYKMFESSAKWIIYDKKTGKQLSPSKSWTKWLGAKMAAAKIGGNAEPADAAWYQDNKAKLMGEANDLEEALTDLERTNILTYDEYDEVKNFKNFNKNDWKRNAIQKKYVRIKSVKESTDLEEAVKWWTVTITKKAGKLFKDQTVDVKARNSAEAIKKGIKQMKGDPSLVPSGSVDAVLGESTDLEEANNRLKAHTPAAAQRLIKKLKNKFSGYNWDDMVKGDEIIYPNELYIIRYIKKQPEVANMKESTELEEAPTDKYMMKDISMALRSAGIGTANVIKVRKLFKGSTADDRYMMKDINLALMSVIGPANIKKVIKALRGRAVKESTELEEATFYKPKANRESETITFVNDAEAKQAQELFTSMKLKVKRSGKRISFINTAEFKSAKSKVMAESTQLDEADAADGAMKGIKAKERLNFIDNIMSTYEGKSLAFYEKMLKKSSNFKDGKLTPYELSIIKREMKRQKQKSESPDLEEAKNATVRELRQMLFKIDSSAADKFRHELFNIYKQDSPATSAQIKKAKTIIGNRFGKDAFVQLEAKSDKQQDIESLEKMIKNPDPRRFSQYGGKEGYLKMLNSKLAKLKA